MKYTITGLINPFDYDHRNIAREMLQIHGKLSVNEAASVVDECFSNDANGRSTAVEVKFPYKITPDDIRKLRAYLKMTPGADKPKATSSWRTIDFTITKSLKPDDFDGSVKVLLDYGELEPIIATSVVKAVISNRPRKVSFPGYVSVGAIKHIRMFFVMHDKDGNVGRTSAEKVTQQLLLWKINYKIKMNPLEVVALILAETSADASEALTKKVSVSEIIKVSEIKGPFENGYILSLCIPER